MHQIEQTFSALGDRTRMQIIERLTKGEASLSDLAEPFEMSQTAVTKHVRILSTAGLVAIHKRGRTRFCQLLPDPLKQAEKCLQEYQRFWALQFNSLNDFLQEEKQS